MIQPAAVIGDILKDHSTPSRVVAWTIAEGIIAFTILPFTTPKAGYFYDLGLDMYALHQSQAARIEYGDKSVKVKSSAMFTCLGCHNNRCRVKYTHGPASRRLACFYAETHDI